jgi:hypothetical protein
MNDVRIHVVRFRFLGLLAWASVACRTSPAPAGPPNASDTPNGAPTDATASAGLHVEIVPYGETFARIQDLSVLVTLVNQGAAPRAIRTAHLAASPVALEVRDARGAIVPPGPPPVPRSDVTPATRVLRPGERFTFQCISGVAIDAPPGHYEVRYRGVPGDPDNAVPSPWAPITVTGSAGRDAGPPREPAAFRTLRLGEPFTLVVQRFGPPDRDIGSGIHIFEYDLPDGTKVALGFPDLDHLHYAMLLRPDGSHEDFLGAFATP